MKVATPRRRVEPRRAHPTREDRNRRIEAVATDLGGRLKGRKVWHVHAHVIIDVGDHALDVKAVRADLRRLTKRRTKRDRSYFGIQDVQSDDAVVDELDQLAQS